MKYRLKCELEQKSLRRIQRDKSSNLGLWNQTQMKKEKNRKIRFHQNKKNHIPKYSKKSEKLLIDWEEILHITYMIKNLTQNK